MLTLAIRIMATAGVGIIVRNAVKMVTPADASTLSKIAIRFGEFGITGVVSDKVDDYVIKTIESVDNVIKGYREAKGAVENARNQ